LARDAALRREMGRAGKWQTNLGARFFFEVYQAYERSFAIG
jgi:hypothetical protein